MAQLINGLSSPGERHKNNLATGVSRFRTHVMTPYYLRVLGVKNQASLTALSSGGGRFVAECRQNSFCHGLTLQ